MPRMIMVEACEPQLPPVSMSMGRKDTSSGIAEIAASKCSSIAPVIIAENISTSSHTMRCFASVTTDVLR